jgi:hypothetical protein
MPIGLRDPLPYHMVILDKVRERAGEFDTLDFHIDHLHFPHFRSERGRTLTMLHGRQDLADHMPLYQRFSELVASRTLRTGSLRGLKAHC